MRAWQRMGLCAVLLSGGLALGQEEGEGAPADGRTQEGGEQPPPVEVYPSPEETRGEEGRAPEGRPHWYVQLGGGAEGYTGRLAPTVELGPAYAATVGGRPLPFLALELGFVGGLGRVERSGGTEGGQGAGGVPGDVGLVRNGAQFVAVLGLTTTRLQPYVVGGVGVENYNILGGVAGDGFRDDTNGYVPAGAGLHFDITRNVSVDVRGTYNFLLAPGFVSLPERNVGDGRYTALVLLGGSY